jgi:hypothetical protein
VSYAVADLEVVGIGCPSPYLSLLSADDRMLCLCDEVCLGFFAVESNGDGLYSRVAPESIEYHRETGQYVRKAGK